MRNILATAQRGVLRRFGAARTLMAFDYDGTLAAIDREPTRAGLRPTTRALLAQLARHYPCVIISGRARADLQRRLAGLGAVELIGNHGIEPWQGSPRLRRAVRAWRPLLTRHLTGLAGVTIEDKAYSLAVHYRNAREKRRTRAAIFSTAATLKRARLVPGKQVLNLVPAAAPHKGLALLKARRRFHCTAALYVGDDETDEDVFALAPRHRVLAIRVGRRRGSRANYFIESQREIDVLLRRLLDLAAAPFRSRLSSGGLSGAPLRMPTQRPGARGSSRRAHARGRRPPRGVPTG